MTKVILASESPRRKELLEQIGLQFEVIPSKGKEIITSERAEEVVVELSRQKAEEVAKAVFAECAEGEGIIVIGADTVVSYGHKILGKPKTEDEAMLMLKLLGGHTHQVYTGVTVVFLKPDGTTGMHSFYETTDVSVASLTRKEIEWYVSSGESMDKAGAYGIQGKFARFITFIFGDYNNVVGLPVGRLYQELMRTGLEL